MQPGTKEREQFWKQSCCQNPPPVSPLLQFSSPNSSRERSQKLIEKLKDDLKKQVFVTNELEDQLFFKQEEMVENKNVMLELTEKNAELGKQLRTLQEENIALLTKEYPNATVVEGIRKRNDELVEQINEMKLTNEFLEKENNSLHEKLIEHDSKARLSHNRKGKDNSSLVNSLEEALQKAYEKN